MRAEASGAGSGSARLIVGARLDLGPDTRLLAQAPSLLLSADAINHPAQLQEPELASGPDDDAEAASRVRRMLIDELLGTDVVVAPPHFGEPFGRVVSDGPVGRIGWMPLT